MNYQTFKWGADFKLTVAPPRGFALSDYDKMHVEMLWREETIARASKLFDGQILNFVSLENNRMVGEFIDYKFYLAQLRDPGLQPLLQITPIAISGFTLAGDKLLIGRRSQLVTQYRSLYECVPSGGIAPSSLRGQEIDLEEQFRREFWEETAISVTEIKRIKPLQIVFDGSFYEICAILEVNYTVIREKLEPTEEYSELFWVPKAELKNFLKKHETELVPLSAHLISHGVVT